MGKSFVLRDNAGAAVGCLMPGMDALHLSFRGGAETDEIALLTKDGTWRKRRIGQQTDGGGWRIEMCDAEGALMLRGGEIVAASGREIQLCFETVRKSAVREKPTKTAPETGGGKPKRAASRENETRASLPERRWPPPPCLEAAVYRKGKWTLKSE